VALIAAGSVSAAKGEREFEEHVPPVGAVTLSAQNIKYSKSDLRIKADTEVPLVFTNHDGGTFHNVAIYTSQTGGAPPFTGQHLSQSSLDAKGSVARQLNGLFWPVFWIAVAVFVLVESAILFFSFKFRARGEDDAPRQIHGNSKLEIAWTIAPALLLAGIAIPTVKTVFDIYAKRATAVTVDVTGHRWWWEFGYQGRNIHTANELYIPAGQK